MNLESLQQVVLAMARDLSVATVLQRIVEAVTRRAEGGAISDTEADIALVRIWLVEKGDLCNTCQFRSECPNQESCLHLSASAGASIRTNETWSRLDGSFRRFPFGTRKIGTIASRGQPIYIRDIAADTQWIVAPSWASGEGIVSFAGYPLIFRGDTLGVFGAFSRTRLDDRDFALLQNFANHAAIAIANARAFEQIRMLRAALATQKPPVAYAATVDGDGSASKEMLIDGRFELRRLIGRGGMGFVYQASDHLTGGMVAIKLIRDATHSDMVARFQREISTLAELDHDHIVKYIQHGKTTSGVPYLAMEWVEGTNLAEVLSQRRLRLDETLVLIRQVACALGAAHARGFIHRDLKPSNVLVQEGDLRKSKVVDFGITHAARMTAPLTVTGMIVGTPGYMAPEQTQGVRGVIDSRTDVFALGCLLFECLTGRPAFETDGSVMALARMFVDPIPRVRDLQPDIPVFLDELCSTMLSINPAQRPADMDSVIRALDEGSRNRLLPSQFADVNSR